MGKKNCKNIRKVNKRKITKTVDYREADIRTLIKYLNGGELAPVRAFLRSFLIKKAPTSKNTRDILKKYVQENIANATPAELECKKILEKLKIKFTFQAPIKTDRGSFIADFYIPSIKTVLEVDGGYHHTQEQITKDKARTVLINKKGIAVVRVDNKEVYIDGFIESLMNKLIQ